MTLSHRTILIVVSTFIALFFIIGALSDIILLKSFSELEKFVVSDNVQKVRNEFEETYDELEASLKAISSTISNSGKGTDPFKLLHNNELAGRKLDFIVSLSREGRLLGHRTLQAESHKHVFDTVEDTKRLKELIKVIGNKGAEPVKGIIMINGQPVQIAAHQLPGAEQVLVAGRYLDFDEINRITALTEFVVCLIPLTEQNKTSEVNLALAEVAKGNEYPVMVVSSDIVTGYSFVKDVFDRPAFFIKITEDRLLYKQGTASITYVLLSIAVVGGVFCIVMLFFIRGSVLRRLEEFSKNVSKIAKNKDITERLPESENDDELQKLASSINGMLTSLASAETGLRESEERYRMLFERAPDAILIIGIEGDEAGVIVAANQAAADQHGYTLDELLKMHISDLNNHESNRISKDIFKDVASGDWVNRELWHRKKDGTEFPIEIHAGLIRIDGRKYVLGFDRDITQRKITEETEHMHHELIRQLNEELSRKALDLSAANNELETFNYSVSHDMRGPLTRISGYCQLLLDKESKIDSETREYINRIYESELWLNDMIDALLQLAQLTRTDIECQRVNLSELVDQALFDQAQEHPETNARSIVEPDIIVSGDKCLLKMVVNNLIGNAWKYSSRKNEIFIEFGAKSDENGMVYFVRDNGAGFQMKDASKLFRVFTRLHDSSQFHGTGIGLATVQRIIMRHGGRIWAEAAPDVGATFYFTLPV